MWLLRIRRVGSYMTLYTKWRVRSLLTYCFRADKVPENLYASPLLMQL